VAEAWLRAYPGIKRDEPLAGHSYCGIGGPADYFLAVHDDLGLPGLLARLRESGLPYTVLGAASNTLILDGGVEGMVLRLARRRMEVRGTTVTLSAGYLMPRAAAETGKAGLSGLEFGAGVPGTVGGSVVGNAGAFGAEVKDRLLSVRVLSPDGRPSTLTRDECAFAYRDSRFQRSELAGWVVLEASFGLERSDPASVRAAIQQVQRERRLTQPIERRSLGSIFKNPPGEAAGRLIEACGLKGMRSGGAQIAQRHGNFIVNLGGARAGDVLALMDAAREQVQARFDIGLEPEIRLIGRSHLPLGAL
jgi:UDP-N-acetylmuramate dehydrogenase